MSFLASLAQGQLSILQEKIDHLERLLAENNEIISNIRDSIINLSESVKDGRGGLEAGNQSRATRPGAVLTPPLVLPIQPEDCQFAARSYSKSAEGVQVRSSCRRCMICRPVYRYRPIFVINQDMGISSMCLSGQLFPANIWVLVQSTK